ncbi:MAG TPA: low molecular weight protein arginine phosphatase [Bacillales bacterium]|nr:low molecular weight protein arginine phosphatase [Bacillales bacterium]
MRKILFICTGNTCRSPMAEAIFKHKTKNRFEVRSAGIFAHDGSSASAHSIAILKNQSIPIDHKSKQLTTELVAWSDLILTMGNSHKQLIRQRYPKASEKVYSLKEYALNRQADIADPFGGTLNDYEKTFKEIDEAILKLIEKLDNLGEVDQQ